MLTQLKRYYFINKLGSSSKYVGVSYSKKSKKWASELTLNRKTTVFGRFDTEIEAAEAREKGLIELSAKQKV